MTQSDFDLLEPVLDVTDIQGNIIPGFKKDHRTLLGFTINNSNEAKKWVKLLSSHISTLYEVLNVNRTYKSEKKRLDAEPTDITATWTNIAFSYSGIRKLVKDMEEIELDYAFDNTFKNGLPKSSIGLGDSTDPNAEGNISNWVIGRPDREGESDGIPDVILIIDSDTPEAMESKVHFIAGLSPRYEIKLHYKEVGHDLSYYGNEHLRGHEHFGFKDGISQPGVRGRSSSSPTDFLTARSTDTTDDPNLPEFSSDGNPLLATGEFVIGYPVQNLNYPRRVNQVKQPHNLLRNGSYLVYRRLKQDVVGFENFANRESQRISNSSGFPTISPLKFKSLIVGRWPSGAPVSKSPNQDNLELATSNHNNTFGYADDPNGYKTPVFSHIRKINPRDLSTDDGPPSQTLKRRILRRGIPFGPPLEMGKPDAVNGDRGLLFLSYQTSIREQFEFIVRRWANSTVNPSNGSSPGIHQGGLDLVIGQKSETGTSGNRVRSNYLRGKVNDETIEVKTTTEGLSMLDWVIPTGGGYFFSPSIRSLTDILGAT